MKNDLKNGMKNGAKKGVAALLTAGAVLGGITFVSAQTAQQTPATQPPAAMADARADLFAHGRKGPGVGVRGVPFGRLALGTTVRVTFYDGDPEAGGTELNALEFTYGEDSEVAFAQAFASAREEAAYMVVEVSEQTRTVDLQGVTIPTDGRGLLPRELHLGGRLTEGSTLTATFYDGDPDAGGQVLQTLSFTYGEDSAAGFANDFAQAAQEAAFVTITTSPQRYTIDLSAASERGGVRDGAEYRGVRGGHRR